MNTDPENRKHSVARRHQQNVLANAGEVVRGLRQEPVDRKPTQHNAEISGRSTLQMSHFLSHISS